MQRFLLTVIGLASIVFAGAIAIRLGTTFWRGCDTPGGRCCGPDGEVNTEHCHRGLGCDIPTGRCEACGAADQPCCDGDFTGFSMKGYTGILLDSRERIESCNPGTRCDARPAPGGTGWIGTRRCQACGTREGGPCCAPDVRYALGRCFSDGVTGARLVCDDPYAREAGTCVQCGRWHGDRACMSGTPCADWLVEQDGLCVSCGNAGTPTCDRGAPCRDGRSVPDRSYSRCVPAGGANQPCLPSGGCDYANLMCTAAKLCQPCGGGGELCCSPGHGAPCVVGECREGRCFACGYKNMPVCTGGDPCRGDLSTEPVSGFCRPCGGVGQPCCYQLAIRCETGLRCKDRTCRASGGGGASGETWKTCSGQPYTWSTAARLVPVEDANGCVATVTFVASSPAEALQCARAQYGDAAFAGPAEDFPFAVTCPMTGCNQRTYPGRDHDAAQQCAEATSPGCAVEDGGCP